MQDCLIAGNYMIILGESKNSFPGVGSNEDFSARAREQQ